MNDDFMLPKLMTCTSRVPDENVSKEAIVACRISPGLLYQAKRAFRERASRRWGRQETYVLMMNVRKSAASSKVTMLC